MTQNFRDTKLMNASSEEDLQALCNHFVSEHCEPLPAESALKQSAASSIQSQDTMPPERRLLIFESLPVGPNREEWRLMNAPGLPFSDDVRQYLFFEPCHCKAGIITELAKAISLLNSTAEVWRAFGVIIKGPKGVVLEMDGEKYRRAVIEKVSAPPHVCTTCGQSCHRCK
ncbi:hypothetical protein B0A52_06984 [Exophiala mesophila]|uniref:Uncharacterized protein n=1 Tax=Exophiala mesophila TaxID=212818 RepID=A0A438N0X8_EXOME|nr:hypothetical protein B0A52_06984 [Exophiala mesophila]